MPHPLFILMRHGESLWNKKNLFTGCVDVPLTEKGIEEAIEAGKKIADLPIDMIFTSTLIRAQLTVFLAMAQHHSKKMVIVMHDEGTKNAEWGKIHSQALQKEIIPIKYVFELNERWYGDLQGLNKEETAEKYGIEQVHQWRRSYECAPPGGESLKMTRARVIPYFEHHILPELEKGKNILISAHNNSLRSLIMYLEQMSPEEIIKLEIPTGDSLVYTYTHGRFEKKN